MRIAASLWVVLSLLPFRETVADAGLPAVFSDHMVLQADAPMPIWGWAARVNKSG